MRLPLADLNIYNSSPSPAVRQLTRGDTENVPPDPSRSHLTAQAPGKRRPKVRCHFGPKSRRSGNNHLSTQAEHQQRTDDQEIDDLLREIDKIRLQDPTPDPGEHHQTQESLSPCRDLNVPLIVRQPTPAPPLTPAAGHFSRYDLRNLSPDNPFLITDHLGTTRIGPDRVTFCLPSPPSGGPPLPRYYATVQERPRPNPNRFALARLGISEAELEARVAREVDEELRVLCAETRWERITSVDFPRVLTKEDCLVLFEATGVPTSGSLVGVYQWASNIETSIPMEEIDALL